MSIDQINNYHNIINSCSSLENGYECFPHEKIFYTCILLVYSTILLYKTHSN